MGFIKKFSDYSSALESHNVKEPIVEEPKIKEPKLKDSDKTPEPIAKRKDKLIDKTINKKDNIKENMNQNNEKIPTISEIKNIFEKYNLNLGFPSQATNGDIVTDYLFFYNRVDFEKSELKKFINIIESEYKNQYTIQPSNMGGSITIIKENKIPIEPKIEEKFNNIEFINKIAVFKNTIKAKDAILFLESSKIDKTKLWYFLTERNDNTIQIIKYNPNVGFELMNFVTGLITFYKKNDNLTKYISEKLDVSGSKDFAVISNLTPQLKEIIKHDLVKLLSK